MAALALSGCEFTIDDDEIKDSINDAIRELIRTVTITGIPNGYSGASYTLGIYSDEAQIVTLGNASGTLSMEHDSGDAGNDISLFAHFLRNDGNSWKGTTTYFVVLVLKKPDGTIERKSSVKFSFVDRAKELDFTSGLSAGITPAN
jgi:hypothetical protein